MFLLRHGVGLVRNIFTKLASVLRYAAACNNNGKHSIVLGIKSISGTVQ